jgi:hypothetical protein
MVKVIPFTLFEGEVIRLQQVGFEPLQVATASDVFLIAAKPGRIHVYRFDENYRPQQLFPTKNKTIMDLQYMASRDCVVTIEKERDSSAIDVVRVYFNWRMCDETSELLDISTLPLSERCQVTQQLTNRNDVPSHEKVWLLFIFETTISPILFHETL